MNEMHEINQMNETKATGKAKRSAGVIGAVLLVAIALLLNVCVGLIPRRMTALDLTEAEKFTLADSTVDFLSSLENDVTLYVLDADGSNAEYEYFLERLDSCSSALAVKTIRHEDAGELMARAGLDTASLTEEDYETLRYCLLIDSEYRAVAVDYYSLLTYVLTDATVYSVLQSLFGLSSPEMSYYEFGQYCYYLEYYATQDAAYQEYLYGLMASSRLYFQGEGGILSAVEYATTEILPRQYVLTGHGEADLSASSLGYLLSYYGFAYTPLDLTAVSEIPADASAVLLAAPTTDYDEGDLSKLRAYLERGGTLTVLTNEGNLSMSGLTSLLKEYGLSATAGAVGEMVEQTVETELPEGAEGEESVKTELVPSTSVEVAVNTNHAATSMMAGESGWAPVITNGNAILMEETAGVTLTEMLYTSKEAYIGENTEEKGTRTLAAIAEGASGARLIWFTGAESYLSEANMMTAQGNSLCVILAMEWVNLTYRSEVTVPAAVPHDSAVLTVKDTVATVFGIVTILLIPAALIVSGVIVRYKRKKA